MTPTLAPALAMLRVQIDRAWPRRSKASDGWIGDAAHAATKSDHNPDADGIVKAVDITHDPAMGVDCQAIADAIVASRDPRLQYIIYNRRIVNREVQPWLWRPYDGSNPHTKHMHVSIDEQPGLYNDTRLWRIGDNGRGDIPGPRDPVRPDSAGSGDRNEDHEPHGADKPADIGGGWFWRYILRPLLAAVGIKL